MKLPLFLLPNMAYAADVATRLDAIAGRVVCEEDYVSTMLTTTRNQWQMLGGSGFTILQTLAKSRETLFGCDGLIALHDPVSNLYKLMLFEAKVLKPSGMDSLQKTATPRAIWSYGAPPPPAYSHFSDQLGRQHWWKTAANELFIIEFFIDLRPPTAPFTSANGFLNYGSTCVQHEFARNFVAPQCYPDPPYTVALPTIPNSGIWTENDVISLPGKRSFRNVLWQLSNCAIGRPMHHQGGLNGILIDLMQRQHSQPRANQVDQVRTNVTPTTSLRDILQAAGIRFFAQFSGQSPPSWQQKVDGRRD
jgi:hypothetical protein